MPYFIIFLFACTTAWHFDRQKELREKNDVTYTTIQTVQDRLLQSDASQLVKSLHDYILTFHASPSGSLSQRLEELSQVINLNLATIAILNTNSSSVTTLEYFTRLQHAANDIGSDFISFKSSISPAYWTVDVPFRFTLKSTIRYRCWQLENLQKNAMCHGNGSLLLEETFEKVRDTAIVLEASAYMLSQLKSLGFKKLYDLCQPILIDFFQPLLRNPLPKERLYYLQDELMFAAKETDFSRHRYSELVLASFLVVLLASATILLLPAMCKDYGDSLLMGRCVFYLIGMTWFHMMVFFLYFCKLRRDFEI